MRLWIAFLVLVFCGMTVAQSQSSSSTTDSGAASSPTTTNNVDAETSTSADPSIIKTTENQQSSTSPTKVAPVDGGSTTSGGSTENPGSRPSTTTIEPVTQPFIVTTATWPIRLEDTDPTILLQAIAKLNYSVAILKSNLTDLYSNLNPMGDNNYAKQLEALNTTILQLQQNTTNLSDDIGKAIAIYNATFEYAQPLLDTINCFKGSICAVAPTTTPWSPTPSPCPASLLNATETPDTLHYTSSLKFDCQTTITSSNGNPIELNVTATITDGTILVVKNAIDNSQLKNFSKADNGTLWSSQTGVAAVRFEYSANDKSQTIDLNANYSTYDRCDDFCQNNGTCTMVNGDPHCSCIGCYQGDKCEKKVDDNDICNGRQVTRYCPTDAGKCAVYYDGLTCTWMCLCNDKSHPGDNNQTCIPNSFEEETQNKYKWLLW